MQRLGSSQASEGLPVDTRFFWPPLMPRIIWLPTRVSAHTCTSIAPASNQLHAVAAFFFGLSSPVLAHMTWLSSICHIGTLRLVRHFGHDTVLLFS